MPNWSPEVDIPNKPEDSGSRYLVVGSGGYPYPDKWERWDIDDGNDVLDLSAIADETYDEVYASHVLEHVPYEKLDGIFHEFYRILKHGGRLRIAVPDLDKWAQARVSGEHEACQRILFGGHTDPNDFHHAGFDVPTMTEYLTRSGFLGLERFEPVYRDNSAHWVSMNVQAVKPGRTLVDGNWRGRVCMAMTRPRLTFADCADSIARLRERYPMNYAMHGGAFWGQGMTKAIEQALTTGAEYILTVDYDTVFTPSDFEKLVTIMDASGVDALAPLQSKRGGDLVLFGYDTPLAWSKTRGPLVEVTTAHFGCTLIRADAIRKMPKPWFLGVPSESGEWNDDRQDDDIYFWHKFREAGNTVAVTPRVPVGHMQLMVTWPDEYFRPHYQHVQDYNENGIPEPARCWPIPWMQELEANDVAEQGRELGGQAESGREAVGLQEGRYDSGAADGGRCCGASVDSGGECGDYAACREQGGQEAAD